MDGMSVDDGISVRIEVDRHDCSTHHAEQLGIGRKGRYAVLKSMLVERTLLQLTCLFQSLSAGGWMT